MRRQSGEGIGKPSKQHEMTRWENREAGQIGKAGTRTEPPRYRNRETSQDIETIKTLQSKKTGDRETEAIKQPRQIARHGAIETAPQVNRTAIANERQRESDMT